MDNKIERINERKVLIFVERIHTGNELLFSLSNRLENNESIAFVCYNFIKIIKKTHNGIEIKSFDSSSDIQIIKKMFAPKSNETMYRTKYFILVW